MDHVRTWAVRLLVDRGEPSPAAIAALGRLAGLESSGLVQLFLASALQQLPYGERWSIARPLAWRSEFAFDLSLPLMIWYGIEPAVTALARAGCRTFFVAHLSEAVRARAVAPEASIYVLNGLPPETDIAGAVYGSHPGGEPVQ